MPMLPTWWGQLEPIPDNLEMSKPSNRLLPLWIDFMGGHRQEAWQNQWPTISSLLLSHYLLFPFFLL